MARKVTTDDIKQFNELYSKYKSYAEVARQTGWSASTVSKYIDKNYQPPAANDIQYFNKDILPLDDEFVEILCSNFGPVCVLSQAEIEEIEECWKELII